MAAVATRSKPNAFNALHQLQRRLKQGDTVEQVLKAMEGKNGLKAFGFSAGEGAAVVNLVHHIPVSCKDIFAAAVSEFGIVKGPLTHAALGHVCMRPGFQPELIGDDWAVAMKNTISSLNLVAERLIMDFKALPAGLRKPAAAPELSADDKDLPSLGACPPKVWLPGSPKAGGRRAAWPQCLVQQKDL